MCASEQSTLQASIQLDESTDTAFESHLIALVRSCLAIRCELQQQLLMSKLLWTLF